MATEEMVEKAVQSVIKANGETVSPAMGVLVDEVLNWPSWYYELHEGEFRPVARFSGVDEVLEAYDRPLIGKRVEKVIRSYVEEVAGRLEEMKNTVPAFSELDTSKVEQERAVSLILERVLFYSRWFDDFLEIAAAGMAAEDADVFNSIYLSEYGDDDEIGGDASQTTGLGF